MEAKADERRDKGNVGRHMERTISTYQVNDSKMTTRSALTVYMRDSCHQSISAAFPFWSIYMTSHRSFIVLSSFFCNNALSNMSFLMVYNEYLSYRHMMVCVHEKAPKNISQYIPRSTSKSDHWAWRTPGPRTRGRRGYGRSAERQELAPDGEHRTQNKRK